MSHGTQRKEKDCLNCGAIVQGHYCQVCGQENIEPKESFWGMVLHFFYDITHFDGKFFSTMGVLLRKPGRLTSEYMKGKRTTYLHPVRMYVFTSAIFFLLFFNFFGPDKSATQSLGLNAQAIADITEQAYKNAKTREDSMAIQKSLGVLTSSTPQPGDSSKNNTNFRFGLDDDLEKYKSVKEYDSVQRLLPSSERHNWLRRIFARKQVDLNVKYKGRSEELAGDLLNGFLHRIPYLLFVSLPLYALFLKLLYIRRRRQFFYADHSLFLIHLYIFTFILMLLFFSMIELRNSLGWNWLVFVQVGLLLYGVIYAVIAMKNFYRQGWIKTILKFILFNILCFICLIALFIIFMALTVYTT